MEICHGIFVIFFFNRNDLEPDDCSTLKDNELSKKHRNLSTLKCKKKVRYNKVSVTRSGMAEEPNERPSHKDNMNVSLVSEDDKKLMVDDVANLFSDANESTKLYDNLSQLQDKKMSADGMSVHPEILVQETEDVHSEEVADGFHCSLGAPSAASTPLAAANSLLFDYDNDDNDPSMDIVDKIPGNSPCKNNVDAVTKTRDLIKSDSQFDRLPRKSLSNSTFAFVTTNKGLPKSDSQFPVDLSYTQPQSPTIPSRTRSLQQDLNLTADCSVSLLPHGMKSNEDQEPKSDSQSRMIESEDTVFKSRENEEQSHQPAEKGHNLKATKQTTLDTKYVKTKVHVTSSKNDTNAAKRKRESSDESEDTVWTTKSNDLRVGIDLLSFNTINFLRSYRDKLFTVSHVTWKRSD